MKKGNVRYRILSILCSVVMIAGMLCPNFSCEAVVTVQAAQKEGVIEIDTPEELMKIGKDSSYPLSGDYVLTADLDMTGISYTPIGGLEGTKGATSGSNVFNGTFDGQGHLISNLTMDITHTSNGANYVQLGMFSIIASNDPNDYAVVENLVFANVDMYAEVTGGLTAAGTLAGEVNGYATVQNIAVLDGSVHINGYNQSDTVGVGGLIGECRTEGEPYNNNITIKNIYNGAEVLAGSTTGTYYAGGIVGRVRGSNVKELSGCVNTGRIRYLGEQASAITKISSGANESCVGTCYFLFATGDPTGENTEELEESTLKSGILPSDLDPEFWYASEGSFPYLQICKNDGPSGYLGLLSLAPEFADDENASCVTQNFTLPNSVGDVNVTWTSSNPNVISIEGTTAVVSHVMSETKVILTARTEDGKTRKYTIVVVSDVEAEFDQLYAEAGTPLTVTVKNAPEDLQCTYSWSVDGKALSAVTGNSYTPTEADNESFIKVVITAKNYDAMWEVSMYMSDLPVVYIDTEDGNDVMEKDVYKYANLKLQGNDTFSSEKYLYDGLIQIKGRGNSTWDYAASNGLKKPYRLKFDKKANVLDMGKNKHWVLLANIIDHTNMRNELLYEFSGDIGMECVLEFEPCVVILNGQYHGFYQIGEQKRVGEGRIDVFDWKGLGEDIAAAIAEKEGITGDAFDDFEEYVGELDYSWYDTGVVTYQGKSYKISDYYTGTIPEFTGGFVFDMDFRLGQSKFISKFYTDYGYPMFFEAPEYAKTSTTMMNYGKTYLQAFENALHNDDFYATFEGEAVHYSELFDIDSLMKNWYVVEYSQNWDSMKNSTLMYKDLDTEDGRSLMKMGPVWDFDWAWGNMNMYSNSTVWQVEGWHTTMDSFCEQIYQYQNWNRFLVSDPYFAMLVYEHWDTVRAVMEDMIKDGGKIDQLEEYYREAAYANDEKWSSTYGRYGGYGITNGQVVRKQSEKYDEAVVTLEYFVKNRVAWFDKQFTSVENLLKSWGRYQGSDLLKVSDITSTEDGKNLITATVTNGNIKKVAFYINGIRSGEVDVVNGKAQLTVDDCALRTSAEGKTLSNCVQIRAMNADGSFLKSGTTVLTNYKIFEKAVSEDTGETDEVVDTVVINEVESSDLYGGNDWVEIYNKGTKDVDISGWFITDDGGLNRLTSGKTTPIPEGTVLKPGEFYILEENINFTCGLGAADAVCLYDAKSNLIDTVTWDAHAEGTLARVPDGTGAFADQMATKGTSNVIKTDTVNKANLQSAIEAAEKLKESIYTADSWKNLEDALAAADVVMHDDAADQSEVDAAEKKLSEMMEALVEKPVEDTIVINEVESNAEDGGADWIEIYNKGSEAVDISGWFVTDDGGVDRLTAGKTVPLEKGTVLQPGEFYVVEENIDFTCGLGAADGAYLYNADGQEIDFVVWDAHAEGALARVPDGTGAFVDQIPTKGSTNVLSDEPTPTPTPTPTPSVELPYEDVAEEDWFREAVEYCYKENLMTGLNEKNFGAYSELSRAQFALILYRMAGEPEVQTATSDFKDVVGDEWYGRAVIWAAEAGIVGGYEDGSFGPADLITREQMAVMMFRYAKFQQMDVTNDGDYSSYTDAAAVSPFAAEAMQWAVAKGIITGKDNGTKLDPQGITARAETAMIIKRFMGN